MIVKLFLMFQYNSTFQGSQTSSIQATTLKKCLTLGREMCFEKGHSDLWQPTTCSKDIHKRLGIHPAENVFETLYKLNYQDQ
jgi:hypothetical protein